MAVPTKPMDEKANLRLGRLVVTQSRPQTYPRSTGHWCPQKVGCLQKPWQQRDEQHDNSQQQIQSQPNHVATRGSYCVRSFGHGATGSMVVHYVRKAALEPKGPKVRDLQTPPGGPPTPAPALPNKVTPLSSTNWAQYVTPGRKEQLNTLGISLSKLETKVFAQEAPQPMDLDSKQLLVPNASNNQKLVDIQNEIQHMEQGGYTTINNPRVASLYKQMEALKPTPSKDLRSRS